MKTTLKFLFAIALALCTVNLAASAPDLPSAITVYVIGFAVLTACVVPVKHFGGVLHLSLIHI